MIATERALDRFPLVRTQSADEMCDALSRVYAKPTLHLEGRTRKGDVKFNYCQMKDIGLGYAQYGIGVRLVYLESSFTLQTFPVRGYGEAIVDDIVSPLRPRHGVTMSSGRSFAVKVNDGYEHFVLVMNTRALAAKLSALTGAAIRYPLSFDPLHNNGHAGANALRNHFFFLVDQQSASAVSLPEFALAEYEQALMVMFLYANRHNYSHLLETQPPDSALSQIRHAEAYIDANAHRAITLEELAEVTGVSALSLFRSFRRHRGYSPLAFLSQVRSQSKTTFG